MVSIAEDMGCPSKCGTDPGKQSKNELGFRVTDCGSLRYLYVTSGASANANSDGNSAQCQIYSNCTATDEWSISGQRKLKHAKSAIKQCHQ